MKEQIIQAIDRAIQQLITTGNVSTRPSAAIQVTRTKDAAHGDYSSNIALVFAKQAQLAPHELAHKLCSLLTEDSAFEKIEVAGPGFLNFFIAQKDLAKIIEKILAENSRYGTNCSGHETSVHVEFVSANPTGPLHVGHGRGAAYGATLANLYRANGYRVHREYYVNDAGRQMDILATSVWLRYLELCGAEFPFPANGYQGDYIWDIAATAQRNYDTQFFVDPVSFQQELPADEPDGGDKEVYIDAIIKISKHRLDAGAYGVFFKLAIDTILQDIKDDLHHFGVDYDQWFSEHSLYSQKKTDAVISKLESDGHIYEKDGALWFASAKLGDEKDRVVVRENGQPTYFASDIAYHADKFSRGYHKVVNIWGADHHGYIARIRAALIALGYDADRLDVLLVQFANLFRGKQKLQMSTRSGEFVTLRALRKEVGTDAARFFYVMRKSEQHLDFDLELATSTSNENPVYYVQYAHARICSVLRQVEKLDACKRLELVELLTEESENNLLEKIDEYTEIIMKACSKQSPHLLVQYLRELAQKFHAYYNATQILVESTELKNARLLLIICIRQVLANGLTILGVSAPQKM